ncbi:MAG: hypothetical protein ACI4VJ_07295 [Methanosphaera sp.]
MKNKETINGIDIRIKAFLGSPSILLTPESLELTLSSIKSIPPKKYVNIYLINN